jgi:2-polyprenyl-3-methyl-5-hydroxy-6-metoxy-1,4-benzoquinol methylase
MAYDDCHAAGGMTAYGWEADPKRLAFQFARYLFVAKALEGKQYVLEVGCADGQGARIVRQHVGSLMGVDSDPKAIADALRLASERWPVTFAVHDILWEPLPGHDAVYCLDLFEHIADEHKLLANLRACAPVCIVGTPSLESQAYASEISKREHVNCVTKAGLRHVMLKHWSQVFVFGINDTTLHMGHDAMTHYLFAVAVA